MVFDELVLDYVVNWIILIELFYIENVLNSLKINWVDFECLI